MFRAAAMKKLQIFVLERDTAALTEALGVLGVVQLTRSAVEVARQVGGEHVEDRLQRCKHLQERLQRLMEWLFVSSAPSVEEKTGETTETGRRRLTLTDVEDIVSRVEQRVNADIERAKELDAALKEGAAAIKEIEPLKDLGVAVERLKRTSFLYVVSGLLPGQEIEAVRAGLGRNAELLILGDPAMAGAGPGLRQVLVLASRKGRFGVGTVLEKSEFQQRDITGEHQGVPDQIYKKLLEGHKKLLGERSEAESNLKRAAQTYNEALREAHRRLMVEMQVALAQQNYAATASTAVITGWTPAAQIGAVRDAVQHVTAGRAIVEVRDATAEEIESGQVPSLAMHSRWLAPFERLLSGYGSATYREIEPTILFAVSFLLMFGLMFGDLGHGLCLLAGGLAVYFYYRHSDESRGDLGYLVAAAGSASMLFGAFFQGTFFGKSLAAMGFPLTLGFEPIRLHGAGATAGEHVLRYITVSLALGICLISLGVALNVINRCRVGDLAEGLMSRFGLAGGILYWSIIALSVKAIVWGMGASDVVLALVLIGGPLLVLLLRAPIRSVVRHEKVDLADAAMGVFEGLLGLLETLMLYVSNTFSFLRVAAFALSHAALCFTIFVVQDLVEKLPGGLILSVIVFIVGTALVLGLEGLIVVIQIFRLEYYEFFGKFFRGEGRRFQPFRLKRQT